MKQFLFLLTIAFLVSCGGATKEEIPAPTADTTACCVDTCAADSVDYTPAGKDIVLEK